MAQLVTLGETMAAFAPDRMGPLRYVSNYGIRIFFYKNFKHFLH